jgi:hypothetical protein
MKGRFTNAFLIPVEPFTTTPALLKTRDSPRSDVCMCALIEVRTVGEFAVNCDWTNSTNCAVIKWELVNALCQF